MTFEDAGRPTIRLHFAEEPGRARLASYRVSRFELQSNREIDELSAFAVSRPDAEPAEVEEASWMSDLRDLPLVYEGQGWIGGREVGVAARAAGDRHHLELEDQTRLSVSERDGELVVWVSRGRDPAAARFAALGPGLAIGLALAGRFSLHAAAVLIGGRALILMGESGSGKTTMARLASERNGSRRVADDVVPVRLSARGEVLLQPRFPQLKLEATAQWTGEEEILCRDLLTIRRQPGLRHSGFVELSKRGGVLALLESTVGSRLFSKELRERELDTWVSVANRNRILEWLVPDDLRRISESFESLRSLPETC